MFQFTEDCIVGVEQIDAEHQYLISLMNQMMEVLSREKEMEKKKHELEEYIGKLIEYGETHFVHEEEYMEKTKDPELHYQKLQHSMFLSKVRAIDVEHLNDAEKRKIMEDTLKYLTKWLYRHIIGSDTMIGKIQHLADIKVQENDNPCAFTQKYMTGIPQIDEEHKVLFDIIGDAYVLVESGATQDKYDEIMGILDRLEEYTRFHFAHEEEYMEKTNYPQLDVQRRAHTAFLERLEEKDLGEDVEDQQEYLEDLMDFLFGWLSNHILKMDKGIV